MEIRDGQEKRQCKRFLIHIIVLAPVAADMCSYANQQAGMQDSGMLDMSEQEKTISEREHFVPSSSSMSCYL